MVLILGPPKRYITTSAVAFINGQFVCPGVLAGVQTPLVVVFLAAKAAPISCNVR